MQIIDKQIFTIGHGSRKIDSFICLLENSEIELLIDVRTYPHSRFHPQYCKKQLQTSLNNKGIKYLWLGIELGGRPQDPNLYINGKVCYSAIKQTPLFKEGIKKVIELIKAGIKVTLMCSESDQNNCHRKHLIADALICEQIIISHINKFGDIENHFGNLFNS